MTSNEKRHHNQTHNQYVLLLQTRALEGRVIVKTKRACHVAHQPNSCTKYAWAHNSLCASVFTNTEFILYDAKHENPDESITLHGAAHSAERLRSAVSRASCCRTGLCVVGRSKTNASWQQSSAQASFVHALEILEPRQAGSVHVTTGADERGQLVVAQISVAQDIP